MPGEIDFHIEEEIVKRLPVGSLVRFRSVCKAWKCLIDSSYFIAAHAVRQDESQQLFVRYLVGGKTRYVCIVDDDTFPQQRFVPTLPLAIELLQRSRMVGSCKGLVCLAGYYYDPENSHSILGMPMVAVWNPSIGKSIAVPVPAPGMSLVMDQTAFGFGVCVCVCPATNDPKIVMIPQLAPLHERSSEINEPREVRVYTLSSGKWRSLSDNVPSKSVRLRCRGQVIDRFMYWSGSHNRVIDSRIRWCSNLIMSFDMTDDTFQVIDLPHSLACIPPSKMVSISKLRESLVILEGKEKHCAVWMMENGVQKSFTKLFTVTEQYGPVRALGFRKSGKPIMEVKGLRYEDSILALYEPNSQHFKAFEIGGITSISTVNSYMETLLLLGSSDCSTS